MLWGSSFALLDGSFADFLVGCGLSARTVDIYTRRIDSAILWFADHDAILAEASAAELAEWGSQLAPSTSTRRQATVWGWVRHAGEKVGIVDLRPHQLRHTAIATLHDATGDLRTASEFARHRRIETTMVYSRTPETTLRRAVEAIKYQ